MNALFIVTAAGLVPLIVGSVWYHPRVFGHRWMSLKRITPEMAERSAQSVMISTTVTILFGISTAWMLLYLVHAFRVDTLFHSFVSACAIWIAFVVPTAMHRVLWDHVPFTLFLIETGQWLVSLCIMIVVLAL